MLPEVYLHLVIVCVGQLWSDDPRLIGQSDGRTTIFMLTLRCENSVCYLAELSITKKNV